jgi:hypothetical protein
MQPRPYTLTALPANFDISYANLPTYGTHVKRANVDHPTALSPYRGDRYGAGLLPVCDRADGPAATREMRPRMLSRHFFFSSWFTSAGLALS